MIKTITTFLSLSSLILLLGCSSKPSGVSEITNEVVVFAVNSKVVSMSDVLDITLPKNHPSTLSIIDPDGQLYIIHSEEEFKVAKSIEIPIATVKGTIWINGKKSEQLVFEKTGKYSVYMADNLETEPDNTFSFKTDIELK